MKTETDEDLLYWEVFIVMSWLGNISDGAWFWHLCFVQLSSLLNWSLSFHFAVQQNRIQWHSGRCMRFLFYPMCIDVVYPIRGLWLPGHRGPGWWQVWLGRPWSWGAARCSAAGPSCCPCPLCHGNCDRGRSIHLRNTKSRQQGQNSRVTQSFTL